MTPCSITFHPAKKHGGFPQGISFRDAALELGILVESPCGGLGSCGKCKVIIPEGAGELTVSEYEHLTQNERNKNVRLACQATILNDTACIIPEDSQVLPEQISIEGMQGHFSLRPDVQAVTLSLPEPALSDKYFLQEALQDELHKSGHQQVTLSLKALGRLQEIAETSPDEISVILYEDKILEITSGEMKRLLYGVAIDIGTTTVVLKMLNLCTGEVLGVQSAENKQKRFGADVISRLEFMGSQPDGLQHLHDEILEQLNELLDILSAEAEVNRKQIFSAVVTGNTVMQHLFLGINPKTLASAPYYPVFQGPVIARSSELGLNLHSNAYFYTSPNLASFVGGDITSVLTVLDFEQSERPQLVVDIGTNGEIVLGTRERIVCASSPAGPAWEGANIQWGMRATRGAIERAKITENQLILRTIGNVEPIGICGSGLIDLIAEFRRTGLIDESGRILNPDVHPELLIPSGIALLPRENGTADIAIANLHTENPILLTQKDIREVQLAKGAIASGIQILLQEFGIGASELSAVYIAGGFGNHVKGNDAVDIGLLPGIDPENIHFIGNAALTGAEAMLLSQEARLKAEHLSRIVEYVEISGRPEFQQIFVDSMTFPSLDK